MLTSGFLIEIRTLERSGVLLDCDVTGVAVSSVVGSQLELLFAPVVFFDVEESSVLVVCVVKRNCQMCALTTEWCATLAVSCWHIFWNCQHMEASNWSALNTIV